MLLTASQLIVSRLTLTNSGAVKMPIYNYRLKCDIAGTGNRSVSKGVFSVYWLRSHKNITQRRKPAPDTLLWHDTIWQRHRPRPTCDKLLYRARGRAHSIAPISVKSLAIIIHIQTKPPQCTYRSGYEAVTSWLVDISQREQFNFRVKNNYFPIYSGSGCYTTHWVPAGAKHGLFKSFYLHFLRATAVPAGTARSAY